MARSLSASTGVPVTAARSVCRSRDGLPVPDRRGVTGIRRSRRSRARWSGCAGPASGRRWCASRRGEADPGVVQRGPAAQGGEPGIGVGDLEAAAVVEVEVQLVVGQPPAPRLGVVDRRGVARGGSGVEQRLGLLAGVGGRGETSVAMLVPSMRALRTGQGVCGQTQSRISGRSSPVRRTYARCSARLSTICWRSDDGFAAEAGDPVDDVHDEVVAVHVVDDEHVERRGRGALLLVAADVQVVVVGAPVGQPVDQPRVAVVGDDDRPVGGEDGVELRVRQTVRVRRAVAGASGRRR